MEPSPNSCGRLWNPRCKTCTAAATCHGLLPWQHSLAVPMPQLCFLMDRPRWTFTRTRGWRCCRTWKLRQLQLWGVGGRRRCSRKQPGSGCTLSSWSSFGDPACLTVRSWLPARPKSLSMGQLARLAAKLIPAVLRPRHWRLLLPQPCSEFWRPRWAQLPGDVSSSWCSGGPKLQGSQVESMTPGSASGPRRSSGTGLGVGWRSTKTCTARRERASAACWSGATPPRRSS
mmetsp:Transcript_32578/g.58486  ORF Transcript_32578/g.58486 Transcript_32578/m.58486 type:complete len:230 (+) Transcript_32578:95-784(+)